MDNTLVDVPSEDDGVPKRKGRKALSPRSVIFLLISQTKNTLFCMHRVQVLMDTFKFSSRLIIIIIIILSFILRL
jgi:hypothetical protein